MALHTPIEQLIAKWRTGADECERRGKVANNGDVDPLVNSAARLVASVAAEVTRAHADQLEAALLPVPARQPAQSHQWAFYGDPVGQICKQCSKLLGEVEKDSPCEAQSRPPALRPPDGRALLEQLVENMRSSGPRFREAPGGSYVVTETKVDEWADELEAALRRLGDEKDRIGGIEQVAGRLGVPQDDQPAVFWAAVQSLREQYRVEAECAVSGKQFRTNARIVMERLDRVLEIWTPPLKLEARRLGAGGPRLSSMNRDVLISRAQSRACPHGDTPRPCYACLADEGAEWMQRRAGGPPTSSGVELIQRERDRQMSVEGSQITEWIARRILEAETEIAR